MIWRKLSLAWLRVLGPLWFLIHINDIFEVKLNASLQLYADHFSVTYVSDNIVEMHTMITEDLKSNSKWFKENLLVLNGGNTKMLFFNSNRNIFENFPDLFMNNSEIQFVNEMKYLDLIIDPNLNWNSHVNWLLKRNKMGEVFLGELLLLVGMRLKKCYKYAFSYSTIIYLLSIWGSTKRENINNITTLQNKCIRNLFFD